MNIKKSSTLLGSGASLFLISMLTCNVVWLSALLMIAGTTGIAIGGAFFIRATWMKGIEQQDKKQWGRYDFAKPC